MEGGSVLKVHDLTKWFQAGTETVRVLSAMSFSLEPGQSLALTGRSGSGKSTLLNLLCGLEAPDSGDITVASEWFGNDEPFSRQAQRWATLRQQTIGVVFQDANLMPALSLLDNVRLRAQLASQPDSECAHWLELLDIGHLANRYPDQVSGGQRQRAALAMVFAMKPALILADEPTGSLDRHTADDVADVLFRLQSGSGCALVLATHDAELAARCGQCLDLAHTESV